jgi:uncharacterized membrane protein YhaH (DUF805 family)
VGFHGIVLTAMMAGHCLDIASRLYIGRAYDGAPMTYNFRVYALFLLGGILIACGVELVRAAIAIAARAAHARRRALRPAWIALLIVAPLLPIQLFFALIHTVLAAVTLLTLAVAADAATGATGDTVHAL